MATGRSDKPRVQVWSEIDQDAIIPDKQDKDWVEIQIPGGQRIRINWPQTTSGGDPGRSGNQTGQPFGGLNFDDNEDPSPAGAQVSKQVKEQNGGFEPYIEHAEGQLPNHTNVVEVRVIKTYPGNNPPPKVWATPANNQPLMNASGQFSTPDILDSTQH